MVELWGIGDLTFATALIRKVTDTYDVYLLGKPHAAQLLGPGFPQVRFIEFDAPWTVFRNKYQLWKWPWSKIIALFRELRGLRFDVAVSVRPDPRDHLLMLLAGAKKRFGFRARHSRGLLTDTISPPGSPRHRVQDWEELAAHLGCAGAAGPSLSSSQNSTEVPAHNEDTLIVLHAGARIATRRWPQKYFASVIERMRDQFQFRLILVPDPDGYGLGLAELADEVRSDLSLPDLVSLLKTADLLICNDSGPMHIAATVGTPTISFFGPTDPRVFRPWGEHHKIVEGEICVYRPCFDYCRFPEPYMLDTVGAGGSVARC